MLSVKSEAFEYVVGSIGTGSQFERFAQDLVGHIKGHSFLPIGGMHDGGIDGLEYTFSVEGTARTIYQMSIEKDYVGKARKTILRLQEQGISCTRLYYVTNQIVRHPDENAEILFNEYEVVVQFYDLRWLRIHVNDNEGAVRCYFAFLNSNYPTSAPSAMGFSLTDYASDPRVFVFLRQQWEEYGDRESLERAVYDGLILYALEDTDPDRGRFLEREEIREKIISVLAHTPKSLDLVLGQRLEALTAKPHRKIRHYQQEDRFCLPYETRVWLKQKSVEDSAIHDAFLASADERMGSHLSSSGVSIKSPNRLVCDLLNRLYKKQGLEFSEFIVKGENNERVELSLHDLIAETISECAVVPKHRVAVEEALEHSIRELIYRGTAEENEYLRRLSNSYMMLFLTQCDPQLCSYFSAMARRLRVFVCTSILIPAMSELPLQTKHRRHWNLLVKARDAGVALVVTRTILDELCGHIRHLFEVYGADYEGQEDIYTDELAIPYIKDILIRSYFYQRLEGTDVSFRTFIENFVTPGQLMAEELIEWLRDAFGVEFIEDSELGVDIDKQDLQNLTESLYPFKASRKQAGTDARTILSIYGLRNKGNEINTESIFGYKTWWLSKDRHTQRAADRLFGSKYRTSVYIRPDFLYNYISLAPSSVEVSRVFDSMFPTLMGVRASHHIPREVAEAVNKALKEHRGLASGRRKAILRSLSIKLRSHSESGDVKIITHWLDEEFRKTIHS